MNPLAAQLYRYLESFKALEVSGGNVEIGDVIEMLRQNADLYDQQSSYGFALRMREVVRDNTVRFDQPASLKLLEQVNDMMGEYLQLK